MSSTKCTRDPRGERRGGFHHRRYALRVHFAALMHPTPHSAQEMGKGLRERWAVGKEERGRGQRKRVLFGGAWGVSEFAGCIKLTTRMRYGTYVHMMSSGGGRRRKCRKKEARKPVSKNTLPGGFAGLSAKPRGRAGFAEQRLPEDVAETPLVTRPAWPRATHTVDTEAFSCAGRPATRREVGLGKCDFSAEVFDGLGNGVGTQYDLGRDMGFRHLRCHPLGHVRGAYA